jgi:hypothetical protein
VDCLEIIDRGTDLGYTVDGGIAMRGTRESPAEPDLITKCELCNKAPLCLAISAKGKQYKQECRIDEDGTVWAINNKPHICLIRKSGMINHERRKWRNRYLASLGQNMTPIPLPIEDSPTDEDG